LLCRPPSARRRVRSLPTRRSSDLSADLTGATEPEALTGALLAAIRARRGDELQRGVSLVGPHRDDIVLSLGPLPAKGYASHGERSEEHTSELQSRENLVCRLLLEK